MIDWNKQFPLPLSISRTMLKNLGFTDEEIRQFTDADMDGITAVMAQNYREVALFPELHHLAARVLREQEHSFAPPPSSCDQTTTETL